MGFFDRVRSKPKVLTADQSAEASASSSPVTVTANLYSGDEDLEVVGESNYQDTLLAICGGSADNRVRYPVVAALVPESENPYDENAIAVQIDARLVGYLGRDTAKRYRPGLLALMQRSGAYVALEGVVVGGGARDDGPGRLGVWLRHDPRDFGVEPTFSTPGIPREHSSAHDGAMRTGFSEAWRADAEDDSYDLSWYEQLPAADRPAVQMLRELLAHSRDPLERHFQFAELEARLYHCRDLYEAALDEFDDACRAHDSEMEAICAAFLQKWGAIPLLETYRQMAIRQSKRKDWQQVLWWAERGLAVYGSAAARQEAVEDLEKRRNRSLAKIVASGNARDSKGQGEPHASDAAADHDSSLATATSTEVEKLSCSSCGAVVRAAEGERPKASALPRMSTVMTDTAVPEAPLK